MAACPCGRADARGRPLAYTACCARYLAHDTPAPDAEALMRSRYTAFVLERADYLRATWHASRRPSTITFDPGVKWLGLDVRQHHALDDTHAEVEFVARQKSPDSPAVRLHERSRFVREAGRWYYVDGDQL
ncbi:YchJ family metal-binding protein [Rhodoferax sp.]|uniref:YchJ family protein n=1 Tax=Rhodoferax sp. TaxID=50421 RepID=UPI0025D7D37F|nr:YchJ family metal-binding protein [Rhodoferax sp.]